MNNSDNKLIKFPYERNINEFGESGTELISLNDTNLANKGDTFCYNNIKEEVFDMDENKILEKYLDKIDKDRREQEQRLNENIRSMEQRITEERRLSEERMEKKFIEAMDSIKETNKKLDSINSKLDKKVETINSKIDEKTDKIGEKIDNTNKWIIGVCLSTIIGIAAMVLTVILTK